MLCASVVNTGRIIDRYSTGKVRDVCDTGRVCDVCMYPLPPCIVELFSLLWIDIEDFDYKVKSSVSGDVVEWGRPEMQGFPEWDTEYAMLV
jgi:hypothetical protein